MKLSRIAVLAGIALLLAADARAQRGPPGGPPPGGPPGMPRLPPPPVGQQQPGYPPPPPAYRQPVYQPPTYQQQPYERRYSSSANHTTRDLDAEARERAAAEQAEARRREGPYVEPQTQQYLAPAYQDRSYPDQPSAPPPAASAPPPPASVAPPPPRSNGAGGLPDWALPLVLIAALPALLYALRDDEPRLKKGTVAATMTEGRAADLELAIERVDRGDFAGAVPLLQAAVRHDDVGAPGAHLLLAHCFLKTGLPEVACEEIRSLALTDQPLERLYEVANAFLEAGLVDAARPLYLAILRIDVSFRDVAARVKSIQLPTGRSAIGGATPVRPPSSADPADDVTGNQGALPERFAEVKFLAKGGMGVVYEARDRDLDRRVAIKMLAPTYCADAEFVERFFRESRALARLTHPAIVQVFDVARTPVPYIVMEYLDGKSLRRVLAERMLPYRQRLLVGLTIARGLGYAHAQGVVHRDVKPENIILTEDGRTKLLDFGLARMAAEAGHPSIPHLTQPNVVMGTPSYMAPELYMGVTASTRTDAFALGRVLKELVLAVEPDGSPAPPPSAGLAALLDRMTSPDATQRPESLAGVDTALEDEIARMSPPSRAVQG